MLRCGSLKFYTIYKNFVGGFLSPKVELLTGRFNFDMLVFILILSVYLSPVYS